jgi:hypothetical protein
VIAEPQLANQSWKKRTMQDAWSEMAAFSLGLPATALTANGDVLIVYYSGPSTDQTDILWTRVSVGAVQDEARRART